tara:strand:+ start:934 stop:1176 length:243 start_codon:yes stop_codon:yes gene_type:complete
MEKIIFFTFAILAMGIVLYLGIRSTIKGFNAKKEITTNNNEDKENISGLSSELDKLNKLYKSGALNKEEFEKAKAKLLEN